MKKYQVLTIWVFAVLGGFILQFGSWALIFTHSAWMWMPIIVGGLFIVLGLLFALRILYQNKFTNKFWKQIDKCMIHSTWPFVPKLPDQLSANGSKPHVTFSERLSRY